MTFRFARHTSNLKLLKDFYVNILEFEILGSFENHADYNGVFIGIKSENWHLEFTESKEKIDTNFNEDDLFVFYPKSNFEYNNILLNIENHSIRLITPKNPYWKNNGIMILDPDGYRIVISHLKILK